MWSFCSGVFDLMPINYRHYIAAAFASVAVSGTASWSATSNVEPFPNAAPKEAAGISATNSERDTRPFEVLMVETAEQRLSARQAQAESRRNDERNLAAQEDAVCWAKWSFFIGLIQAIISGAGIYFVLKSLNHSHAADAAHFVIRGDMVRCDDLWCVPIDNHGQTIGFVLGYEIEARCDLPALKTWRADETKFVSLVAPVKAGGHLKDAAFISDIPQVAKYVIGKIDYVDVFGVRHLSGFRYDRVGDAWRIHRLGDWCFMRKKTDQSAA